MKKTAKKNSSASLATARRAGGIVRIVGGDYKRTPLKVEDFAGLRPTPERVRETVFDWIPHLLGGCAGRSFCDMFAGSGALGLEAASRGAEKVVSIDTNRACTKAIAGVVQKLGAASCVKVVCTDAFQYLERTDEVFDVIFIDPPFATHLQQQAMKTALRRLREGGLLYVESDKAIAEADFQALGLSVLRQGKAGQVHFFVLKADFP